ncbi:MAG TPA: hypothetical protein VJM12_06360, partial [Pyrinomonadaceae bacterium]|nr:hypothetical protein [Pyrinomonadaceae bacterium]
MTSLLLVTIFFSLPIEARTKRPVTLHDLIAVKRIAEHVISPSGNQTLYVLEQAIPPDNTIARSLWKTTATGGPPQKLKDGATHPRWSVDEN